LREAHAKSEAFETSRHFWKFDVEGWGKMSLREAEAKIKQHTEEKFKLYNFLRPSKRESIQRTVDYFQLIKKDIQTQLATAGHNTDKSFGAARIKYDVASKLVSDAEKARAARGKSIPSPVFNRKDLIKMSDIANRNKDARLLVYVYSQVRDSVLANPDPESLSSVKGKAVMARMDMLKQADRLKAAIEFGEFRQLPIRNAEGWDYTKSLREVEPRGALEFIVRHFTDTAEQKRERQAVADGLASQLSKAQEQSTKARDWSVVRDVIEERYQKPERNGRLRRLRQRSGLRLMRTGTAGHQEINSFRSSLRGPICPGHERTSDRVAPTNSTQKSFATSLPEGPSIRYLRC
jgi:hypothetical protein